MSYRSILLCPDEHTLYQLSYMDKKSDVIIALSSSLDYELPEGAVLLSRDAQSSERISIPHCSELLKHAACIKLIYCALSVSEYLSMLYFVSLCKELPIQVHDFSQPRPLPQDDTCKVWCTSCKELDESTYHNASFHLLTQKEKDDLHQKWLPLSSSKYLKCFSDLASQTIQLLSQNAFDAQILTMISEHKSFASIYRCFLTDYGLSEKWLLSRCHALGLSL